MKHKDKTNDEFDNIDSSCIGDESADGQSSISHNDQDSDVSSESDNDEEIDTTEIEEEYRVDNITMGAKMITGRRFLFRPPIPVNITKLLQKTPEFRENGHNDFPV